MYQPAVFFIGLRYIRGHTRRDRFYIFVSWLATIGITLGVVALVVVLSVMNGFERVLQNNILELMPQAVLLSTKGSLNPQQLPKSAVMLMKGVKRAALLTTSEVVLLSTSNLAVGLMLGIDPEQEDPLASYIVKMKQADLSTGKYNVILGKQLAKQLNVSSGDQLRIIVPYAGQFTPLGYLPHQHLFNVIGIFAANSEVDSYQILVNIQDASRLIYYSVDKITGWRLWLKKPFKVDEFSRQKMPEGIKWQDWRERKGELFHAVHMEKNIMGLLMSMIIIIAGFNIMTSLSLKVMEKQREIAILQVQGLTPRKIMIVFMVQGVSLAIIGSLIGAALGVLFASQLNNLIPIINIMINDAVLPVAIDFLQVINIVIFAVFIGFLSTIYPSWRAVMTKSIKILCYE